MDNREALSIEEPYSIDLNEDEFVIKWLMNRKFNTQKIYRRAMVLYSQFLKEKYEPMTPKEMLIERGKEDRLDPWERGETKKKSD